VNIAINRRGRIRKFQTEELVPTIVFAVYGIYTLLCVYHYLSCLVQLLPGTDWHDFEVKFKVRMRGWLATAPIRVAPLSSEVPRISRGTKVVHSKFHDCARKCSSFVVEAWFRNWRQGGCAMCLRVSHEIRWQRYVGEWPLVRNCYWCSAMLSVSWRCVSNTDLFTKPALFHECNLFMSGMDVNVLGFQVMTLQRWV
jgi:hypothetical protein